MFLDQSYGIVPLKKEGSSWLVFLVRHKGGHWTLPKGHPEGSEMPLECAKRELFEETALNVVRLIDDTFLVETYQFRSRGKRIHKTVHYFIAEVTGTIKIQLEELLEGRWLTFDDARALATYPQMKQLLKTVEDKILAKEK